MSTLKRKDELRLAAITLIKAELLLYVLGEAYNLYEKFGSDVVSDEPIWLTSVFGIVMMVSLLVWLIGLKTARFAIIGVSYFISTVISAVIIYILNELLKYNMGTEEGSNMSIIVSFGILALSFISMVFLLVRQRKAYGRISDRDKKLWMVPGVLLIAGYVAYFAFLFIISLGVANETTYMIRTAVLVVATGLALGGLLQVVAMFSCMRWLTCPEVISGEEAE